MRQLLFLTIPLLTFIGSPISGADAPPNVIIIFTDDQGYGDLGCFGSKSIRTPHLDQLASEGRRFTNFLVPSSVCTPSRAALLTGCYPRRIGMHEHVLFPQSTKGLHPDEITIADHLKANGYATACIGKWHLGHHPETLPRAQGFDFYYGIPYSNDMNHPENQGKTKLTGDQLWADPESTLTAWKTPLMKNEEIIELPVDQRTITRRYTDRAIDFVDANKDKPFFLYLAHTMPHFPLYVPDDVRDPNPQNAYTNVIEHLDTETGRLIQQIRDLNLAERTIIVFTTDNGPWLSFKNHGGSAGPLRSGKGTTFEGGQRVPCIVWAPGRIPPNTQCAELASTLDIMPTLAMLTGNPLQNDRLIDGMDISVLLTTDQPSPRQELLYYASRGHLDGIRQGPWKLLAKGPETANQKRPRDLLFNLNDDLGEQVNLAEKHPEIVARLSERMKVLQTEIEANARAPWQKPQS